MMSNIWGVQVFLDDALNRWRLGSMELGIQHTEREWLISVSYGKERINTAEKTLAEHSQVPDQWFRFTRDTGNRLFFEPVVPDLPLVVRPEDVISVLPGTTAQFFVGIPIFLRIRLYDEKNETTLLEIPSVKLSRAWFGSFSAGEMCYSLPTTAKTSVDMLETRAFRCICPLQVKNNADKPVMFEKVCLFTNNLRVYKGNRHLWTNEARISYQGSDIGRTVFAVGKPPYDQAEKLLGSARDPNQRGFLHRAFENFKRYYY